jgi:ribosome-associated protein
VSDDLPVDDRVTIPGDELSLQFSRSGGPGGQHVNTTDTRARLRWAMAASTVISGAAKGRLAEAHPSWVTNDGDVVITSDSHRSRHRNVDECRERLAQAVHSALRPPRKRRATKPSRSAKKKRLQSKKRRGDTKRLRGRVRDD